jgi:sulfite exporter TauE/SafE
MVLMNNLAIAFVTGLTTGGLSCLAVQGGLLASSIAHEVEQTVAAQPAVPPPATSSGRRGANSRRGQVGAVQPVAPADNAAVRPARPIALFLIAKVIAYTLLGFLLGLLGSVLRLNSTTRAILQIAIGVFMLGAALRMLNVHPIFRYFAFEPPHAITRYIRRKAKGQASAVTPLFLGALTVLIPCGVTQAMMAVAIATGDGLTGAATMLAFTLGTTPVFFTVAYLATRLGSRLEKSFIRIVAVLVFVLGLVSIDSGLTMAGWPYSPTNLRIAMTSRGAIAAAPTGSRTLHWRVRPQRGTLRRVGTAQAAVGELR